MDVAIMSPWNVACGVSVHAELVGREIINMGHELTVLAPILNPAEKAKLTVEVDEPYVVRCYTFNRRFLGFPEPDENFDPKPFLSSNWEVFIVENLELMPVLELLKIWGKIRGRKILIVHEGAPPFFYEYYSFKWDKIVVFDDRYFEEFSRYFPRGLIEVLPFPYHPLKLGDKREARRKLDLPLDKKIVFSYGLQIEQHFITLPVLEKLSRKYDLLYLVIPTECRDPQNLRRVAERFNFLEFRVECPLSGEKLYTYLHAADIMLLYKKAPQIVVSSSVAFCLGSGCPIVINESRYTERLEGVFTYRDPWTLEETLTDILDEKVRQDLNLISNIIAKHSPRRIAERLLAV